MDKKTEKNSSAEHRGEKKPKRYIKPGNIDGKKEHKGDKPAYLPKRAVRKSSPKGPVTPRNEDKIDAGDLRKEKEAVKIKPQVEISAKEDLLQAAASEKSTAASTQEIEGSLVETISAETQETVTATESVTMENPGKAKDTEEEKKKKGPRRYEEIMADLSDKGAKNASTIERYIGLLLEIKNLKDIKAEQIPFFFASVHELLEEAWAPFLTRASMNVNPNEPGSNKLIAEEIQKCCAELLEDCGLRPDDLQQVFLKFRDKKDTSCITEYLKAASEAEEPDADNPQTKARKITEQELACVAYTSLVYRCRTFAPADRELLRRIDRVIAEYFGKVNLKEQAGRTVGSVLAMRSYSTKRIADLTYLYDGTTDTIRQQSEQIAEIKLQNTVLQDKIRALSNEVTRWKVSNADMIARIENLENVGEQLKQDREHADSMLEYERNRFERQMQTKEAGIAEQLSGDIKLEIEAIRETLEFVDEDNQRRIRRRLKRIDDILTEYGGNTDA